MDNPSDAPSFVAQALAALARSGMNALAGVLVSAGALTGDQSTQFVTIGVGLVLWLGNYGWSLRQKRDAQRRLKLAIAAPPGYAVMPQDLANIQAQSASNFGPRR